MKLEHYAVPEAVADLIRRHNPQTHNAVDAHDLAFLNWALAAARPDQVIEIGTASGLSAAAMALMLETQGRGPARIWTADLRPRCYWDDSLPVGFVIADLPPDRRGQITQETGVTALDAPARFDRGTVGFAFVDANHQHPWPLIDTLCLLPLMIPGSPIVHHDLQLYRDAKNRVGGGPKLLYDQIAPQARISAAGLGVTDRDLHLPMRAVRDNIYALKTAGDVAGQAAVLAQAFCLPWTIMQPLDDAVILRLRAFLAEHYPPQVARFFEIGLESDQIRHRYLPAVSGPLWQRIKHRIKRGVKRQMKRR
jgi:hypothetical protein